MSEQHKNTRRSKSGFTLLEAAIASTLLVIVFSALAAAIQSMQGLAATAKERGALQTNGQDALIEITRDLRRSGIVDFGGTRYPIVFDDGDPGVGFPEHAHLPANKNGAAGDEDAGPDRSILFLAPQDADGDRRPDVDGDGELLWDGSVCGYVLVTNDQGVNVLQRRVEGRPIEVVARFVERVAFDDAASSGWEIPLGSVRVRLWLRRVDGSGQVQRFFTEAVVALRNG